MGFRRATDEEKNVEADISTRSGASQKSVDSLPSFREDIGKGTWYEAGYHLCTTIATPAAYAPLAFAIASLTWTGGVITLLVGIAVTWYCSILLSSLDQWDGERYVRYRDLSRSIWGPWGYYSTILFQQIASIGNNITVQIAAGISAKSIYTLYQPSTKITLQEFIIMFGAVQLLLSQLPDIHTLRHVNILATFCTIAFSAVAVAMSIYNGNQLDRSTVSYSLPVQSDLTEIMGIFSALGIIAFTFGDTLLPEIQAVVNEPVKRNMYKGVSLCYSIITMAYIAIGVSGYWAFGNGAQAFILANFVSPSWVITFANVLLIVQVVGCYQIYCRPTYEYVEVRLMDLNQKPMALRNCATRLLITTCYIVLVTLIACMLPFFGYFAALVGAIGFTPLDFIMPACLYLTARRPKWYVYVLNITISVVYSAVAILGSIGAIHFIIRDAQTFKLFANLY